MDDEKFKNYIHDLGVIFQEKAKEAKLNKDNSKVEDSDYNVGYLMAFHEVISLMKHQAIAFNIEQEDIGLADIDPESDLL